MLLTLKNQLTSAKLHDIVMSKSFDNGMVCASEQAVIIDKEIYDEFVEEFKSYHTYFVNKRKSPS